MEHGKIIDFSYDLNFVQALNLLVQPIITYLKEKYPKFRKATFFVDRIEYDYMEDCYVIDFYITLEGGKEDFVTVVFYIKENKWVVIE